ncbi:uncharacterized protein LOC126162230 [Schistocerca cancellata]|uniref:uncharacterized protein LOC126162230 n=1 Tax=Schistocerca cancellata TaxID=274614 RepID=UPI002117994F|nr:uncharacterized protein LOC126162230 [Schistocerca cancellata]
MYTACSSSEEIIAMVNKYCVPGCDSNYDEKKKVHIFKFPADENTRRKWLSAIKRENFVNQAFCGLPFVLLRRRYIVGNTSSRLENRGYVNRTTKRAATPRKCSPKQMS